MSPNTLFDEEDFKIRPLLDRQEQLTSYEYDVALSFGGEDRSFCVNSIASVIWQ